MGSLDCKKVLIAGGTGFIGRRTVSALVSEGADVHILSRRWHKPSDHMTYYIADLNDLESLDIVFERKFDICVFMAANIPEIGQKKETFLDAKKSTFDAFVNFCEVFSSRVSKFIYISTIDVLGGCPTIGYDESAPIDNPTPYGLAKYCGELYATNYCRQQGIPLTILRFSQVYGSDEPMVRVIPILRDALLNGKEFVLYSDGSELRKFLFVDDAVQGILCALQSDNTGIYNIAGSETCSMLQLIEAMESVYGVKLNLTILNKAIGRSNVPSIDKAVKELGYSPKFSIKDGLEKIKDEEEEK